MPEKRILCVGLMCVDLIQVCKDYPIEDSDQRSTDHRWKRGGNASNNCTVISKCGQICEYLGTMSDDMLGRYAFQDFEKHKIIIKNVVKHRDCDCPFSSVLINAKNGSRTIVHSNKNLPELTIEDFRNLDLEQYKWIHFEGRNVKQVVLMLKYVLDWNSAHSKIVTSVELEKPKEQIKELLPLADFVFIGKDFATFQGCKNKYEAVARNIALVKPKAGVIVAWGESGAAGQVSGGEVVESAASPPPAVVDTLGAGDTFLAATIVCLSQGCDLRQSIAAGCRVAGVKVYEEQFLDMTSVFTVIHPGPPDCSVNHKPIDYFNLFLSEGQINEITRNAPVDRKNFILELLECLASDSDPESIRGAGPGGDAGPPLSGASWVGSAVYLGSKVGVHR